MPLCVALSSHSLLRRTTKRLEIHKNLRIRPVNSSDFQKNTLILLIKSAKVDSRYPEFSLNNLRSVKIHNSNSIKPRFCNIPLWFGILSLIEDEFFNHVQHNTMNAALSGTFYLLDVFQLAVDCFEDKSPEEHCPVPYDMASYLMFLRTFVSFVTFFAAGH